MKVSSINSISSYNTNKSANLSFKHIAVPYPEYEERGAYSNNHHLNVQSKISQLVGKISDLFHPSVTKEANEIKKQIDQLYDEKDANSQLISVLT